MTRPALLGCLGLLAASGCDSTLAAPRMPSQTEWDDAHRHLAALASSEPAKPYGALVHVTMREPHLGKVFSARGALAVDPHRALRMILVGPGGSTAIDVWVTNDEWRFEVPPASIRRRGGADDDAALPIGFFRWWFLGRTQGRLMTSEHGADGERLVLSSGGAVVDLIDVPAAEGHPHVITATRLGTGLSDRLEFHGVSFAPTAGDHATYDDDTSGVHVEVEVEGPNGAPDPAAFADPDAPARSSG